MSGATLTIDARTLRDLLTPVMPLAGKDDMLPVLCCVLLETEGNTVTAAATDRFRLGVCRAELAADAEQGPFKALVKVGDLKRVLALFKVGRFDAPVLTFTLDADRLTVTSEGAFDGMLGGSLTFFAETGEFPKLTKIILEALTAEGERPAEFAVNGAFLADFKHAVRDGHPLQVRAGVDLKKPIAILCGDHFAGVIMPRALISDSGSKPAHEQWIDWLTPKPEPKPARKPRAKAKAS